MFAMLHALPQCPVVDSADVSGPRSYTAVSHTVEAYQSPLIPRTSVGSQLGDSLDTSGIKLNHARVTLPAGNAEVSNVCSDKSATYVPEPGNWQKLSDFFAATHRTDSPNLTVSVMQNNVLGAGGQTVSTSVVQ